MGQGSGWDRRAASRAPLEICGREFKVGPVGKSCFSPASLAARYRPRLGRELGLCKMSVTKKNGLGS